MSEHGGSPDIDETDKAIIRELQLDGRLPYSKLGPAVGLSQAAARQRVQRMVDRGVMQVVAVTDPAMLGFAVQALVGIEVQGDVRAVADSLTEFDEAEYVVITAGRYDIFAEVVCVDMSHLLALVNDRIRVLAGVQGTEIFSYLHLVKQTYSWGALKRSPGGPGRRARGPHGGAAPLGEDYREGVLWQESVDADADADADAAGRRSPSTQELPSDVDAVVVGGGYCGLQAATTLAERGRSVVVLDSHDLGWGASSRNGGMVIPELKAGPAELRTAYGSLGTRLHREVEDAFDHVEALAGPDGPIDCDYSRTGQLYLTHGERGVPALRSLADDHRSSGADARVVTGDELVAEAGSHVFRAGLVLDRTGGLHPAKFHAGLVSGARRVGAALFPHTTAVRTEPGAAGGHLVRTSRGVLHARDVLVATNAYADDLNPSLARRVLPMESFIIATEPLDPEQSRTVLPTRRMTFNDRHLLWYWRHGPDGRLLFGGRKRLGEVALGEARDHLYRSMLSVHPQLAGIGVDRVWGGRVALTLDRMPHCGRVDGLWYATGCNGSGVALNTWMGRRMAEAICGDALPAFAELTHRPIPLHRLRSAWLPVVGSWFRLQDRRAG